MEKGRQLQRDTATSKPGADLALQLGSAFEYMDTPTRHSCQVLLGRFVKFYRRLEGHVELSCYSMSFNADGRDYVEISGSIIPPATLRCCGPEFKDHHYYLRSAEFEAARLIEYCGCNYKSKVLDIGCGQGRLPIGILRVIGEIDYLGIDVSLQSVDWCNRFIGREHASFRFLHLNVYNERYNLKGIKLDPAFQFPLAPKSFDIIYLFSVFSHTTEEDMKIYLNDLRRVLRDGGRLFFSAFVEDDVADLTINPEHYVLDKCVGPLHVVRYNRSYLFSIIESLGFSIKVFTHGTETDRQSAIYLAKH